MPFLHFLPLWRVALMGHRALRLLGAASGFWLLRPHLQHIWKACGEAAAGRLDSVVCTDTQYDESFVYVCLFPYFLSWVNYFFL